ncbi:MAG TPA: hypothetical protein PKY77_07050 [Phycisphaerae bacterium]|nr:hypothetical protein [Phycisphaerae bacterium]HRY69572.1 hypothetical protein [Phycisphaerae bacterium]HSA29723.1 hypothetical protein [Phycisphaerae bacterium]
MCLTLHSGRFAIAAPLVDRGNDVGAHLPGLGRHPLDNLIVRQQSVGVDPATHVGTMETLGQYNQVRLARRELVDAPHRPVHILLDRRCPTGHMTLQTTTDGGHSHRPG